MTLNTSKMLRTAKVERAFADKRAGNAASSDAAEAATTGNSGDVSASRGRLYLKGEAPPSTKSSAY